MVDYLYWANRHNWDPDTVDRQPWAALEQLRHLNPIWDEVVAEARAAAQEQARREAQA